uniref:Ribosomal protein S7 n=1 Tax=Paraurostyla sp. TaxID=6014 RepID=A0A3Q8BI15_9STIC|nr:ribosomal protein S7 [Paraurostyla sp.]
MWTNINETNINETNINETNINETNINETNINETKFFLSEFKFHFSSEYNLYDLNLNFFFSSPNWDLSFFFFENPFILNFYIKNKFFNDNFLSYKIYNSTTDISFYDFDEKKINFEILSSLWSENLKLTEYIHLKKSSFISFFLNNFVDVPICFKKSKSLKYKSFELPVLKFCNYLMKKGKKIKLISFFFSNLRSLQKKDFLLLNFKKANKEEIELKKSNFFYENNSYWFNFFLLFNSSIFFNNSENIFNIINITSYYSSYKDIIQNNEKIISKEFFFKKKFIENFSKISPIFAYYIQSVSKNIKKFSRGKSGKYQFIWKYIPIYKRIFVVMRWLAKEIKFNENKNFSKRLTETMQIFENTPQETFTLKSKNFSHNFVFKNFKKNLMQTLKTNK